MENMKKIAYGLVVIALAFTYLTISTQKELVDECVSRTNEACVIVARTTKEVESKGF